MAIRHRIEVFLLVVRDFSAGRTRRSLEFASTHLRIAAVVVLLAVGSTASTAQDVDRSAARDARLKSPELAFGLSGLGLLIPVSVGYYRLTDGTSDLDGATFAILAGGIIVGPAIGHFYAESDRAWTGISLRLVSGLVSTGATYAAILFALGGENPILPVIIMTGGAIVAGTSAVLDIVRAPASAQAWNERHPLTVRPVFHPKTSSFGASVRLTF